ncbi:MAG: 4Fe-4S dicluster domain-containing protein [Opitutales bacterium]|nr:4Fe-4S dicluster domain-containing protein [Opitutales bacterium]
MKYIRCFRIVFAVLFFAAISLQFFDIYHSLPDFYYDCPPTALQFMPSLLKFFAGSAVASAWAFLAFMGLALILGRAYCSFVCPFGILMDILRRIAVFPARSKFLKKTALGKLAQKKFANLKYSRGLAAMRIAFLCLAILAIIFGFGALLGLIDPYSLYGKIMGGAFVSASESVNFASAAMAKLGVYAISPVEPPPAFAIPAFGFSIFLLILTAAVSALQGRLFCNTICPVGSLLGGISKFALFRLEIDKSSCLSCGKCERGCKAKCINSKGKALDFSRCVLCLDCAGGCPKNSIGFKFNPLYKNLFARKPLEKSEGEKISRRAFAAASLSTAAAVFGCKKYDEELAQKHSVKILEGASKYGIAGARADKRIATPPGSKSVGNFLEKCTACQRCVASCKGQVLKASTTQWGLAGFMQPYMDFSSGFCQPECVNCSKACPTGAIAPLALEQKKSEKIGTAIFNKELCVVYTDGTDCAACAEHCPVLAIDMVMFNEKKSLYIPKVDEDVCIGCGACEHVCPVRPHTAIVIQGLEKHKTAKKFVAPPVKQPKRLDNPFPDF